MNRVSCPFKADFYAGVQALSPLQATDYYSSLKPSNSPPQLFPKTQQKRTHTLLAYHPLIVLLPSALQSFAIFVGMMRARANILNCCVCQGI